MENKRYLIIGGAVAVVIGVIFLGVWYTKNKKVDAPDNKSVATTPAIPASPQRIDFGTNTPTDFPTDIPMEKGAGFEQSYSLDYSGQKQLTIVFPSSKTVKENYVLYANFLKKQNWIVSNKYESDKISSLYGTKEGNDINITINESLSVSTVKSQISISVLKK